MLFVLILGITLIWIGVAIFARLQATKSQQLTKRKVDD